VTSHGYIAAKDWGSRLSQRTRQELPRISCWRVALLKESYYTIKKRMAVGLLTTGTMSFILLPGYGALPANSSFVAVSSPGESTSTAPALPAIIASGTIIVAPAPSISPGPTASPTPSPVPTASPAPTIPTVDDAKAYLVQLLGDKKDPQWHMTQAQCASDIFEGESKWDPHAANPSGAYGIPQAKPASKIGDWADATAQSYQDKGDSLTSQAQELANDGYQTIDASLTSQAQDDYLQAWLYRAWKDNPVVQAQWGVNYMISRYGSPCNADAFRSGYYDKNGVLHRGAGFY